VVCAIMENVRAFTGDAPQSDDITLLMIEYVGPQ
jgi:serine phosphatase RsbU (regulator of sigma subunit)